MVVVIFLCGTVLNPIPEVTTLLPLMGKHLTRLERRLRQSHLGGTAAAVSSDPGPNSSPLVVILSRAG